MSRVFISILCFGISWVGVHGQDTQSIDLAGQWKFQTGDDESWASSAFDDAEWADLDVPNGWGLQGYSGYSGFAWVRRTLTWNASDADVYVLMGRVLNAYALYVNGQKIGSCGELTPEPHPGQGIPKIFAIPSEVLNPSGLQTVAVRVWRHPDFASSFPGAGGLQEGPFWFGDREFLTQQWWSVLGGERSLFGGFVFRSGDDLGWSKPELDDSDWMPMIPDRGWMKRGFQNHYGFAWYRTRIRIPLPQVYDHPQRLPKQLGIRISGIVGSYQVFAGGQKIAEYGGFPPNDSVVSVISRQYAIPHDAVSADGELVLAVRVFRSKWADIAFPDIAGMFANATIGQWEILRLESRDRSNDFQAAVFWIFSFGIMFVGLYHLVLVRWRPKQKEYLWFGLFSLDMGLVFLLFMLLDSGLLWVNFVLAMVVPLQLLLAVLYLKFANHFFNLSMGRWGFIILALLGCAIFNHWFAMIRIKPPGNLFPIIAGMVAFVFIVALIFHKAFFSAQRNREAKIVALANLVFCFCMLYWLGLAAGVLGPAPVQHGMIVLSGTVFLLGAMAYSLASRFSQVHAELDEANRDLEDKVARRTEELTRANERLTSKEAILSHEMAMAKKAQTFMLSRTHPNVSGLDISALSIPAKDVGGDYYDFFHLESDYMGFAIGDVSGKGLSAALYMTLTKGLVQAHLDHAHEPESLLGKVNDDFLQAAPRKTFMSLLFGVIDPDFRHVTIASAGHHEPLLLQAENDEPEEIACHGMALGLAANDQFGQVLEKRQVPFPKNAWLIFYTDGIIEARNGQGEEFGLDQLVQTVLDSRRGSADELVRGLKDRLTTFVQDQPPHDDMTLVCIKRKG